MKQLTLPLAPPIAASVAAEAFHKKYGDVGPQLLADPSYDVDSDEWIGLVAITPWGPLVRVAFRLVRA